MEGASKKAQKRASTEDVPKRKIELDKDRRTWKM